MRVWRFILTLLVIIVLGTSCDNGSDKAVFQRLKTWDAVIDSLPAQISDSLKTLDVNQLSRTNRAYYHLLKVISDDKTYVNFTSDSLINSVTDYYRNHEPDGKNFIRSLVLPEIRNTVKMEITVQ